MKPQQVRPMFRTALFAAAFFLAVGCSPLPKDGVVAQAPTTPVTTVSTGSPATPATPKASMVKVPNGVGLDYQSAQDAWRGAGLIVAPAEDATGAHRTPVVDSNWVVLEQDLTAGSKVQSGSLIKASVKKYTDD